MIPLFFILTGAFLVVVSYILHHLMNRVWILEVRLRGSMADRTVAHEFRHRLGELELKSGIGEAKFSGTSYTTRPPIEEDNNCGGSVAEEKKL